MFQSLAMAVYLIRYQPFMLHMQNYLEIFNELVVLAISYHMTLIMSENLNSQKREIIGISLIIVTTTMILVNAVIWIISLYQ